MTVQRPWFEGRQRDAAAAATAPIPHGRTLFRGTACRKSSPFPDSNQGGPLRFRRRSQRVAARQAPARTSESYGIQRNGVAATRNPVACFCRFRIPLRADIAAREIDVGEQTTFGLDLGSHWLKASDGARCYREPSAVLRGGRRQSGWRAYRKRRSELRATAVGLRPHLQRAGGQLTLAGQTLRAVDLQADVLAMLRRSVVEDGIESPAVVATIPDAWDAGGLIPAALAASGWRTLGLVREWTVAAVAAQLRAPAALLLSLGCSGVTATYVEREGEVWRRRGVNAFGQCSFRSLAAHFAERVSQAAVATLRRDLREHPETDQAMHDAVDDALLALQSGKAEVEVRLDQLHCVVGESDIERWFDPLQAKLGELIASTTAQRTAATRVPIIAWGGLAGLRPIQRWLTARCDSVKLVGDGALAEGAAMVSRHSLAYSARLPDWRSCQACGAPAASPCEHCGATAAPVPVWDAYRPLVDVRRRAFLVQSAVEGDDLTVAARREISGDALRLGRDPRSDWVFEGEGADVVSAAHAVIFLQGEDYQIRDLESTNQTFVNGGPIRRRRLQHGDQIRLGRNGPSLRFELSDADRDDCSNGRLLESTAERAE